MSRSGSLAAAIQAPRASVRRAWMPAIAPSGGAAARPGACPVAEHYPGVVERAEREHAPLVRVEHVRFAEAALAPQREPAAMLDRLRRVIMAGQRQQREHLAGAGRKPHQRALDRE
jgi:hypothetical protein